MFLAISGKRATYLYGASSSVHREMMGTYALQWNAIRKARETGCKEYDLFGISETPDPSHPMYGLYRFKTGFGGYKYHRQGCWDYPFNAEQYEIYRSVEMNSTGYHLS
jgi:lipid II:glycine glycyltransferase (peptidoglycan interpeptide bridge formation enzyme)